MNKKNVSGETSMIMGGYWKDIPTPYVFFHPNPKQKRRVRVGVMRYYGVGVHFYATVDEESNHVWDGKDWRLPWGNEEGFPVLTGKNFSERFDTYTEAVNFVNSVIAREFSPETHKLYDGSGYGKIEGFMWDFADDFDPNED